MGHGRLLLPSYRRGGEPMARGGRSPARVAVDQGCGGTRRERQRRGGGREGVRTESDPFGDRPLSLSRARARLVVGDSFTLHHPFSPSLPILEAR